jgi:hypothetical protein
VQLRGMIHSLGQSIYAYFTFFARFGRGGVGVADWMYRLYDVVFWLSLAGTMLTLWNARHRYSPTTRKIIVGMGCLMLGWLIMLVYGSNIYWSNNQGRYMLPALAGLALIFAVGISVWFPKRWASAFSVFVISLLAATSIISVYGYFLPSYQISPSNITDARPLYQFGDVVALYEVEPNVIEGQQGDYLTITLHWQALQETMRDLRFLLETVNDDGSAADVIYRESYPATGNLLAQDWEIGQRWAEHYWIAIPLDAMVGDYALRVSVIDAESGALLSVKNPDGEIASSLIAQVRVVSPR